VTDESMPGMKTLLTGGTGFVGSAVARELLAAGHEVRVLVRSRSPRDNLEGLDVECVEGDLLDPGSLKRALKGCRALFHVAADYRLWVRDPHELERVNVTGTEGLMTAALDEGIERVVYTSSVATLASFPDGRCADEATPVGIDDMVGAYKRSKFLAEERVRALVTQRGAPIVIVNPSAPVGPRDIKPTPTGRMILEAAQGRIPAYVDTGLNVVHVADVARGHVLAYERGRVGERYILGGTNLSLKELLEGVTAIAGRAPPRFRLPRWPLYPVAWIDEGRAFWTGREPRVTRDALRMARKKMYYCSRKAQEELGYESRPWREAVADALDWFYRRGWLERPPRGVTRSL
jgi:dihydroflavonol-4-reductase